ncbi:hypothetical protein NYP18_09230 [Corynebacterium sp. YIM 101645]|uniref:Uncharacterized protein n=1 Tax=Corynebacterium lemuris TaxID=1859292 RepID=A0ABT2FX71_9CORY|nr:hypothetical protein [Corynebacterium lemuris]MCS5479841.1 hypothetical protein [Corynebacterium lemuris]
MTDWTSWQAHVEQTIADRGQWVGLCDGHGRPLIDMPTAQSMTAGQARLAEASLSMEMKVTGGKWAPVHPVVDLMIADGLGVFDEEGRLVVKNNIVDMVVVAKPGRRHAYVTSFPTAVGDATSPNTLRVQGTDLIGNLVTWPCPSVPQTWIPNVTLFEGDASGAYETPRLLSAMEMSLVADGYTMSGPAEETIRTLVQDSFDAVNYQCGWEDTPHMVVDMAPTGRESPLAHIRVTDGMVWETIAPPAQLAGVNITIDLWWPGDDPVLTRLPDKSGTALTTWTHPIGVVRIEQGGQ